MNKRLSVLIWVGVGIAISVALFALFVEDNKQLALVVAFSLVAYILFLYVLSYLASKIAAWIKRYLGIILTLVAVVLVLSWRLEDDNYIGTFLFVTLMLGLIWWRTIVKEQGKVAWKTDRLFGGNITQNTNAIVLQFFSGEFQDREYVIKKIWKTNTEVQLRLEEAIRRRQRALLNNPQTFMPGNAFVYLIRQEEFANKQFSFKIGRTINPGDRLGDLQTGNPHLLHLWAVISFPTDADARRKEGELQEVCRAYQKRGEWFHGDALKELLRAGRFTPYFNIPQEGP